VRIQDNYTCINLHGFGVFEAALIAKTASHFASAVTLEINGPDEAEAMEAIVALINDCFGEGQ
jgi:phosphotransferase system HPr-like phosphotransfer protein